ncbi:MAG: hypothetical protein M3N46_07740 [Actinomycetota bacterium]|nr:hypothetical protein [Actinomycetota bacterium]
MIGGAGGSWRPPWPPIRIAQSEWIVMRDSKREPVAVIRALRLGPRDELFFRVVTWAADSAARTLLGYFPTLDEADQSVLFSPPPAAGPPSAPGYPVLRHTSASETERD